MDSSLYSLATDSPSSRHQAQTKPQILEIDQTEGGEKEKKGKKKTNTKKNKKEEKQKETENSDQDKSVSAINISGQNSNGKPPFSGPKNKPHQKNKNGGFQGQRQSGNQQSDSFSDFSRSLGAFLRGWSNGSGDHQVNRSQNGNSQNQTTFLNASAPSFQPAATYQTRVNPVNESGQMVCWNCDGLNHHQRFCMAPRRVLCFGCGRKDTYRDSCPTCTGNEPSRLNTEARQSQ
jgi:hypothetical protein